jgi:putative DNA methylase
VPLYGVARWGDLFNARQQLALVTFVDAVRRAHAEMLAQGADPDFAKAVATYLALGVDRLADKNSVLCRIIPQTEAIAITFTLQALPMLWDYYETNISSIASAWSSVMDGILENIEHFANLSDNSLANSRIVKTIHGSATNLPWADNFFDAVITDPPYYDQCALR